MKPLEYYDIRAEEARTRSFERKLEAAEINHFATQSALAQHPVVQYVLNLPREDTSYPAISELDFAKRNSDASSSGSGNSQERKAPWRYHRYIHWNMPGSDSLRPKERGCGFITNQEGGLVYTACPSDREHHCKAKRFHCWSLMCRSCINDAAIKKGIEIEKQLLSFKILSEKAGTPVGEIGHWVVSPPQELAKSLFQTKDDYDELIQHIDDCMVAYGGLAGVSVPHAWRQGEDRWRFSPHFHILCYGRIDTTAFRKDHPGWVIKKIHAKEKIRSIRHTCAYLLTHYSIGIAENDPDSIDWDSRFLDFAWPDNPTDKDWEDLLLGKGRLVGDYSDVDWLEWTKKPLSTDTKYRYWGGAAQKKIRKVGYYRQYKIRVCEECGSLLRVFDGPNDPIGQMVRYIQDNPVVVFAENLQLWRNTFLRYKERMRDAGMSIADLAQMLPFAASSLEFGLPVNKDIVCDGPFDDEATVLARQRKAYGEKVPVPEAEA